jgi:hypothetical protein
MDAVSDTFQKKREQISSHKFCQVKKLQVLQESTARDKFPSSLSKSHTPVEYFRRRAEGTVEGEKEEE